MKLLLVNPPYPGIYREMNFQLPPLGLLYLAAALRKHGIVPDVLDMNCRPMRKEALDVYDVVGISTDTSRFPQAAALGRWFKQRGATVVFGGPHTHFTADTLDNGVCDYVIHGEGEAVFPSLLEYIANRRTTLPACVSDLRRGVFHNNRQVCVVEDLDSLPPPARDLIAMEDYRTLELGGVPVTSIITSRGCPHACSFCCSSSFSGRRVRRRSVTSVFDELQMLVHDYGFPGIAFLDDCFLADKGWVHRLFERVLQAGLAIKWWCFARADTVLRFADLLDLLARSGLKYVFIGVETYSQSHLDTVGKNLQPETVRQAVRLLKQKGIETMASFILGYGNETLTDMLDTIRYARSLHAGSYQFSILTPYPGTALHRELEPRICETDLSRFDCMHLTYRLERLFPDEVYRLLKKAYLRTYMRPARIAKGLVSSWRKKGVKPGYALRLLRYLSNLYDQGDGHEEISL